MRAGQGLRNTGRSIPKIQGKTGLRIKYAQVGLRDKVPVPVQFPQSGRLIIGSRDVLPFVRSNDVWARTQKVIPRITRNGGVAEVGIERARRDERSDIDPEVRSDKTRRRRIFDEGIGLS